MTIPIMTKRYLGAILPWVILLTGFAITGLLHHMAQNHAYNVLQDNFQSQTREITARIKQRMISYEQVLWGIKGLFAASEQVTRTEFHRFVEALQLPLQFPGIQAVGFTRIIPPQDKEKHIQELRNEGFPQYTLHPEGERSIYSAITYVEPFSGRNLKAFGFDMYSEAIRRVAMERARDSDQAVISGKVTLVQEDQQQIQSGFLMYVPIYANGPPHTTLEERRTHLIGWSYAAFRMNDLMNGILGHLYDHFDLEIYDQPNPTPDSVMFDADGWLSLNPREGKSTLFQSMERLDLARHTWSIIIHSLPTLEEQLDRQRPRIVMMSGLLTSVLLSLLVWSLATGRIRALKLAHRMTHELQQSEHRWKFAIEGAGDGLWDWDLVTGTVFYSKRWKEMLGFSEHEIGERLEEWQQRIHPEDQNQVLARIQAHLNGEKPIYQSEHRFQCKDGQWKWMLDRGMVVHWDAHGKPKRLIGTHSDITERKQAEDVLILSRKVFDNVGEAILITNEKGLITDVNPAYERITGYRREELLGKSPGTAKSGRHDADFYRHMWEKLTQEGRWEGEIWDRRKNGELFPKWLSINAIRNAIGELTHYVGVFIDISDRKDAEQKLVQLAFYDPLTGLPNRLFFRDRLTHELVHAGNREHPMALMFLDLDRFKWVNDTLGHAAGDDLLKEVAKRLQGCVQDNDTVARLGGDEFTIILANGQGPEQATLVAEQIINQVREPMTLHGQVVHVGVSIGIAVYPGDAREMEDLIKFADMAMYQAKEAGRNTFRFASNELHIRAFARLALESDLHQALDRQELVPYYQPKFNLHDNRLIGAEALVRWIKPDGRLVNPGQFIPLAEETGLVVPMGKLIRQQACQCTAQWFADRETPFVMAINLSSREFQQPDLLARILDTLDQTRLSPERMELEITESAVMGNLEQAIHIMRGLRDAGIALAMDDFGTGYSSLGYLKKFPLNTLKIDQSFIRDLPGCHGDGAIVEAILSMAHSLKLKVVAEGVETVAQLEYLRQKGCEAVQGYLLGKPMPEKEFVPLLDASPFNVA